MDKQIPSTPAFGQADLSNCEREQIHLAGSIQPHGILLAIHEQDHTIVQASENAATELGSRTPLLGKSIAVLKGDLLSRIKSAKIEAVRATPVAFRCQAGQPGAHFDALVHRVHEKALIVELERAGPAVELRHEIEAAISALVSASSLDRLCNEAARIIKDLTGYDRVMIYKFDPEGHGQVFSESHRPDLESYLGNWYPASDIPQIARRLYERNRVRMLADVAYKPVPLAPQRFPLTGEELDMSLCFLRSMSPIHIEYLKNMGVSATLVASLMVGGKLWGLIACHHYSPRYTHYEHRTACEILAEVISTRIASLESFARTRVEMSVRRLEDMMLESVAQHGDWKSDLLNNPSTLLEPVDASGVALVFDGTLYAAGNVPSTQDLRAVTAWLEKRKLSAQTPLFATKSLATEDERFVPLTPRASGVLAAAIPDAVGGYLIWFRPERRHTVTWGGDPKKPFVIGNSPSDLSPRRSFAKWHQVVEGTSVPWTSADIATARMIATSVADVILQFRALRLLIVQDQLERVRRQVRFSDQLAIAADAQGRILMTSKPFRLLGEIMPPPLKTLSDLDQFFSDPASVRERLTELTTSQEVWRGEVALQTGSGETKPLIVRADPVYSGPGTLLGYLLFFTDISEQKAAEAARKQSLKSILEAQDVISGRLGPEAQLDYISLFSLIVGNARRASLEISDGINVESMPDMIQSVKLSVARTAELLENLMAHGQQID